MYMTEVGVTGSMGFFNNSANIQGGELSDHTATYLGKRSFGDDSSEENYVAVVQQHSFEFKSR